MKKRHEENRNFIQKQNWEDTLYPQDNILMFSREKAHRKDNIRGSKGQGTWMGGIGDKNSRSH